LIVYFEKVTLCLTKTHSNELIESLCIALGVDGEISKSVLEEIGRDDVNLTCMAQGRVRGEDFENDDENLGSM
jgi:hypothetical protein